MSKNTGGKNGRPLGPSKPLTEDNFTLVKAWIAAYCTQSEICDFLGMSRSTLNLRFKERGLVFQTFFDERRAGTKAKVRKAMLDKIGDGDTGMMIWWSKNHLGMSDKQAIDHSSEDGSMSPKAVIYKLPDNGRE